MPKSCRYCILKENCESYQLLPEIPKPCSKYISKLNETSERLLRVLKEHPEYWNKD